MAASLAEWCAYLTTNQKVGDLILGASNFETFLSVSDLEGILPGEQGGP